MEPKKQDLAGHSTRRTYEFFSCVTQYDFTPERNEFVEAPRIPYILYLLLQRDYIFFFLLETIVYYTLQRD